MEPEYLPALRAESEVGVEALPDGEDENAVGRNKKYREERERGYRDSGGRGEEGGKGLGYKTHRFGAFSLTNRAGWA